MQQIGITTVAILLAAAVILSVLITWLLIRKAGLTKISKADDQATRIVEEAIRDASIKKKEALLEAKDEVYKSKVNLEREMQSKRVELQKSDKRLADRETALDRKVDLLNKKERDFTAKESSLQHREKAIKSREEELNNLVHQQNMQLEKVAGMTSEEARNQLMENLIGQAKMEAAVTIKEIKENAERTADKEAREIITQAIYRCAADHTVETTVSVVSLPSDEMKGRIIGREGRNIRSFETCTGIDVIVDDTPEAVILSGYDPIRREVARMALERLVSDGRIHPARIEEIVEKCQKEMEMMIREAGEQACFELGIHDLHNDIIQLLGKLNYRTSYGQNVLQHSKEVSIICGLMAAELGLDATLAKRCGLLHDIGKSIDRETEGTHTEIGAAFLTRYVENEYVVNAVASHHGDIPMLSPYAVLVQSADAISGSRPGARREPLEGYIKRLEKLEEMADSFKGVARAFAIQAGREIRVIVEHDEIDDAKAQILASDIAMKIQTEMEYPGQIKVTVIRETRAVDYAK
ncbi:MAG: ribonuclease Y [candidate division Zixibacteria bacterium]|nr:ribonuclease Y [candidate division Zixibacteria bacterium]MBU1471360.1 ribonuclease Y [candidate division Zixibacteria bacterium]